MDIWNKLSKPPTTALKTIKGGRLAGMTDINPQWRYKAMTEAFGPCGLGWKYELVKLWCEPGTDGQVVAFAQVNLYIAEPYTGPDDLSEWSSPIPGIGGSMLVTKETKGLRTSDEAYKMATTDALSVAMKMIGVASEIYEGNYDGSKYRNQEPTPVQKKAEKKYTEGEKATIFCELIDKCTADNIEAWMGVHEAKIGSLEKEGRDKVKLYHRQIAQVYGITIPE